MSIIGRSAGRSAVACAAYRSGQELTDSRYGVVHDYRPRTGIAETGIEAPADAPKWVHDRERLWNAVEAHERRKDAQLSREFVLAFPCQAGVEERRTLLQRFIREQIVSCGLVADWAIHAPNRAGDERNWHAHVMTTMRGVSASGFSPTKDRSLNASEQLIQWREAWAELQNRYFAHAGIHDQEGKPLTVDHRSYAALGLAVVPTLHLGPHATAMERSGKLTDLGDTNREIVARNAVLESVRRQAHELNHAGVESKILSKRGIRRISHDHSSYDHDR